jgi:para-aminobenzoate synthetase component 1
MILDKSDDRSEMLNYFEPFAGQKGSIWLDSSYRFSDRGRYSIIAIEPIDDIKIESNPDSFFQKIENIKKTGMPMVGYIGYETAMSFIDVVPKFKNNLTPSARFLVYDKLHIYDHQNRSFIDSDSDIFFKNKYRESNNKIENSSNKDIGTNVSLAYDWYKKKIEQVKYHIVEGDIYQANFTHRFVVKSNIDPFVVHKKLRQLNPAPYGSFMNFGDYQIISSSPERMFIRDGSYISSSPIKGTIERGVDDNETKANLTKLITSEKDKAELLMIVDLVRNDLGKIAKIGSVTVDEIFKTEIYSSLIHLVSDISAELIDNVTYYDIFKALLPGGSITGAPKKRAVEIINELEASERSVYTGCIGYILGDKADFNIAIRTMLAKDNYYYLNAGGGIVNDSQPELEYNELLLKTSNLFKALEG